MEEPSCSINGVDGKFGDMDSDSTEFYSKLFTLPVSLLPITAFLFLIFSYYLAKLCWYCSNQFLTVSVQVIRHGNSGFDIPNYDSLLKWIGKNLTFQSAQVVPYAKVLEQTPKTEDDKTTSDLDTVNSTTDSDEEDETQPPSKRNWEYRLSNTAGYGTHYFRYRGCCITLKRDYTPMEMLTFTTYRWNKHYIDEILEKGKPKATNVSDKTLVIYTGQHGCWSQLGGPKRKRPLNSLILDSRITQTLMTDIRNFLKRQDWYVERGIPYRRGYLIHGPPGCGKSSVIKAIAGEIGYDICVFSLSQKLDDDSMNQMLNDAPRKSIILLEDIDAAFKSREEDNATSRETNLAYEGCSKSALTFRGLLNALDGVGSAEHGQLLFMSTNYPERLDPALVRPGRVDLKVRMDYPDNFQLEGMFERFFPRSEEDLKTKFVAIVKGLEFKVSMAMIQGLMVIYADDPKGAVENAKEHFESQNCSDTSKKYIGSYT